MSTGIGAPIAVGALAVYGAWQLGSFIWDNRQAIGKFFSNAWNGAVDFGTKAAKGVAEFGGKVVGGVKDFVGGAVKGAGNSVKKFIPRISLF